jgi:hypothetical protein
MDFIAVWAPDAMVMDGFDDCVVGVADSFGQPTRIVYDREAILMKLVKKDGMTKDEALDWIEYNMIGSYVGEAMPLFLSKLT